MKRYLPLLLLALAALFVAGTLFPSKPKSDFGVEEFGRLPVLVNGRLKPFDTVARSSLLVLQGRQRFATPQGETLAPVQWLLDVLFRPKIADTYRHFYVINPEVLAVFGKTQGVQKNFSFNELAPGLSELQRQAQLADPVEAAGRTSFQRELLKLRDAVVLYHRLKNSLQPEDSADFLTELMEFNNALPAGLAAIKARRSGQAGKEEDFKTMAGLAARYDTLGQTGCLLPIPPDAANPDPAGWQTTGHALLASFERGAVGANLMAYAALGRTWRLRQPGQFNEIVRLYRNELAKRFAPVLAMADVEWRFNHAQPFYTAMILYVCAFLLAICSWLKWPDTLGRGAFYLIGLAWLLATAGIATRMWLEGRPPVTNLYSSAVFVGWGSVALCLVLERIYHNAIGSVAGSAIGFATLLIAHHLALGGDTLEMMRAVLDSNFWLATHVVVVTTGYAATFLAGFLAIIYVVRGVFTKSLDPATSGALTRMVYGIVCFATLFSLVGTVLGGIWADQSWGRFWGWDPKENGALIIVLWNALTLHARWGGMVKQRGLMALALFGNIVTGWSWFGVNMLGVGLHSYGFMDAAFYWLIAFVASQLALIGLALLPEGKWRSFNPRFTRSPA